MDAKREQQPDKHADFWQAAAQEPWRQSFIGLLRLLSAQQQDLPPVGQAQRPQQERFRLGQRASLGFAPSEVAKISERNGALHILLHGLGSLGPNGGLPLHVTEWVRERSDSRRDETMADFLNMFHHRMFSHFYRAWAQSQSAAGLDRSGSEETFTPYVARLGGDEPVEVEDSALPPHARWATVAHRVRASRNPDGLVAALGRFFGVHVRMEEFRLYWMPLDREDECRLGVPRRSSILGQGAIAGEVTPDRQTRFRLKIGPVGLQQYLRLTPQGYAGVQDLPALVDLVRAFIGFEYIWEVELLVRREAAPACQLGDDTRLGWSTWIAQESRSSDEAAAGMIFEPESYFTQARPPAPEKGRAAAH